MQSIRDIVKASIDYACDQLTEDDYAAEKIYKKFIKNPLIKDYLNKQINYTKKLQKLGPSAPELMENLKPDEVKIALIVAEENQIDVSSIFSRVKKRTIVDARIQLASIYYIYFRYTYSHVAKMTDRDHSTIIHCVKENENCLDTNIRYKINFHNIIMKAKKLIPHIFDDSYENLEQNTLFHQQKIIERLNYKNARQRTFEEKVN